MRKPRHRPSLTAWVCLGMRHHRVAAADRMFRRLLAPFVDHDIVIHLGYVYTYNIYIYIYIYMYCLACPVNVECVWPQAGIHRRRIVMVGGYTQSGPAAWLARCRLMTAIPRRACEPVFVRCIAPLEEFNAINCTVDCLLVRPPSLKTFIVL